MGVATGKPSYCMGPLECQEANAYLTNIKHHFRNIESNMPYRFGCLSEDATHILYLPGRLLGYATRERLWGQFLVDHIQPPSGKDTTVFEQVLLEPTYKTLIEAVFDWTNPSASDDMFGPKKGLVLLFHGMCKPNRFNI